MKTTKSDKKFICKNFQINFSKKNFFSSKQTLKIQNCNFHSYLNNNIKNFIQKYRMLRTNQELVF